MLFSIIHDITERKDVEEKLRQSEERFRNFLNAAEDIVFIKDQHYRYVFVNKANQEFFGLSEEEIIGKTDFELMPQEAAYSCHKSDQLAIATNDIIVAEEHVADKFYESRKFPILLGPEKVGIGGIIRDITVQRQNQAALKESEELFKGIFEFSPVGKSLTSPEGKLLMVNKAFAGMLGYTVEELQGINFSDITAPEDLAASRECVRILVSDERKVYRMEKRYVRKDGVIVWVDLTTTLFRNPNGVPLYFLTTVLDITYRKQAEAALMESEFRSNRAELVAGLGNWEVDLSTNKVTASNGARRIYGVGQEELTLDDIQKFPLPEYRSSLDAAFTALVRDGAPYDIEFKIKRANDNQVVDIHSMAHYDPEKNSVFGTIHDITYIRHAEENYRLLFAAIEQAAEGIIITDATGMIQYVNPAEKAITGYSSDELIGRKANIFKSGKQDDDFYRSLWQTISAGNVWTGRFVNKKKDGTEYYEDATISPVYNKSGKLTHFVAVKRDVTKHLELSKQLFQAQKMEAVGTLAGGVAHDFNNLLQAVLGYSELILQRKKEGEPDYADLQKIYQAGKRGADLVKSLLTFSRKAETKYVPIDLNHEITSVRDLLFRTIPKTIRIDLRLSGSLESIKADPSQISQVLMNLGVNARDAMPDGGTLTIETTNIRLDEEYCKSHLEVKPGNYVELTFSDTGQGMDKETLSHIFEPFFTTKEMGKGTGLGLATVYGIVKQHGGQINCYSEPGRGTTFKIYFPAIEKEIDLEYPTINRPIPGGTETVLLVDDDDVVRDLGATLLVDFGYKVIAASNGKEALEIYQREGERISLIILDLIMPEMDGMKCLDKIIQVNPKAKVIIASGYSESVSDSGAMALQAKGFVHKPYNMRQLLTKVREILDKN
ncbi:MAG: PAS domain S-box protein [Desulfomonilaceae bacterium]